MYVSQRGWANDRPRVRPPAYVLTGRFHFRNGAVFHGELYRGSEAECKQVARVCHGGHSECLHNPVRATDFFITSVADWERLLEHGEDF